MIVKIWPIKADYADEFGKVGGVEGLKNTLDYITDEEKVIVKPDDIDNFNKPEFTDSDEEPELKDSSANRTIQYMANEEKIKGKYISGYMCTPEKAISEFDTTRSLTLAQATEVREKETGAIAFHIVQSFPEGLDITDEEVHQCGLELCEKIKVHQAVVCSHVHPAVNEKDGEVHGKCKHNHILINAYIHQDMFDPRHPEKLKYHDCKETYALLRQWNDEIAIEHGLPIIRNPDNERTYSWEENAEANKGLSWRERIRMDIESARKISSNWNEFVSVMENAGYKIRDGAHITYTAPDDKHKARADKLGKRYTKENLELYWSIRSYSQNAVEEALRDNSPPPLLKLFQNPKEQLLVGIPLGGTNQTNPKMFYTSPEKLTGDRNALESYFEPKEVYDLYNSDHVAVASATGAEIISCIELLRGQGKDAAQWAIPFEDEYEEEKQNRRHYTCYMFINSKTKKPYKTSLYDSDGRRRNTLELLFILAITVLKNEDGLWAADPIPEGYENEVLYADTNWKIQNMVDSMYLAKSEGIETLVQLEQRLVAAGAEYSRAKSALKKTMRAKENMETLNQAVGEYMKTKDLAERLQEMPDGDEKTALQEKHKDVIQRYKNAKAVMYRYQVTEDAQVEDFIRRYNIIKGDVAELEGRFEESKEKYSKLKKLSYNASLAENAQYCYGPEYTYERAFEQMELAKRKAQTETEKRRLDEQIEQSRQNANRELPERGEDRKK